MSRCVPPCGHGAPKSRNLPAEPVETAVCAEIEAQSEEMPLIFISEDVLMPEVEAATGSEPPITEITAEEKNGTSTEACIKIRTSLH